MRPILIPEGSVFGHLTVTGEAPRRLEGRNRRPRRYMVCDCDCGTTGHEVALGSLRRGQVRSCGCRKGEGAGPPVSHGESYTRLYRVWVSMKSRCTNDRDDSWPRYGGRGITIDPEWIRYEVFRDWARANGYIDQPEGTPRPDLLALDRIDPDGNYTPSNCQWIPMSENSRKMPRDNRRRWVQWTLDQLEAGLDPLEELDRLHDGHDLIQIDQGPPPKIV